MVFTCSANHPKDNHPDPTQPDKQLWLCIGQIGKYFNERRLDYYDKQSNTVRRTPGNKEA